MTYSPPPGPQSPGDPQNPGSPQNPGYPQGSGSPQGPGYPQGPQYPPAPYAYPPGYPYGPGYPIDPATGQPYQYSDKSKIVAGLLGILLGGFGAGRFYTGHTNVAVYQLLLSIFTCGIGGIWGLVDGIMILVNGGTDAQGRPLRPS